MIIATILLTTIALLYCFYAEVISEKSHSIPFFTFVITYYLFFHGIFPYYAEQNVPHLPYDRDVSLQAFFFTLAFIGFQFAGYLFGSRLRRFRQHPKAENSTSVLIFVSWAFMAGYFVIHFILQHYSVPSLPQLQMPCWYFAFSALTFLLLQGELSWPHIVALFVAAIAKLSMDLQVGLLTPVLFSGIILLSAALRQRSYRTVFMTILVCFSLFGSYGYIKHFARTIMNDEPANIHQFSPDFSLNSLSTSLNSLARRSGHLLLTGHVMERTPALIPYDQRNPFTDAIINHVPRVFWPSKPRETLGNSFGKKYGILLNDDDTTSWNLPWTVDFYISFGPILSIFSIFCMGGLFGFIVRWLSTRPDRPFWFGIYSATLFPLFYQESNFSVMAGSIFTVLIFLLVAYGAAKTIYYLID